MDYRTGTLSPAGLWHLVFSVVQSTAIYVFLGLWALAYLVRSRDAFVAGLSGCRFYVVFALLGILNFLVPWFNAGGPPLAALLRANWLGIAHFLLAIGVFLAFYILGARHGLVGARSETVGSHRSF